MNFWTDSRIADLKRLAAQGWSASQIGAELGCGRGAVTGLCFCKGIQLHGPKRGGRKRGTGAGGLGNAAETRRGPSPAGEGVANRRRAARMIANGVMGTRAALVELTAKARTAEAGTDDFTELPLPADFCRPVPLLDLAADQCRFPLGDPRDAGFGFCGAPRAHENLPYCDGHCRMAYQRWSAA